VLVLVQRWCRGGAGVVQGSVVQQTRFREVAEQVQRSCRGGQRWCSGGAVQLQSRCRAKSKCRAGAGQVQSKEPVQSRCRCRASRCRASKCRRAGAELAPRGRADAELTARCRADAELAGAEYVQRSKGPEVQSPEVQRGAERCRGADHMEMLRC